MVIVVACILAVLTVPLAGGSLLRIADLRLRHGWAVAVALGTQILITVVIPAHVGALGEPLHLASYGLCGWFLVANRHIPGLWLVGLGGLGNFAAIVANGGVMPASPSALDTAGLSAGGAAEFENSAAVADAHLAFLGDVFAIPASLPLSNVFSVGDVAIVIGLAAAAHAVGGSRLVPTGNGRILALAQQPTFVRLWLAQVVSNLGDFAYALAVGVSVVTSGEGAGTLATVLMAQAAPAVVVGIAGGHLVDRLSRRRLMIAADVVRGLAVASLLLAGDPSTMHLLLVALTIGTFGALFQPALQASLPNLVPKDLLVGANAVISTTFHVSVLVGPLLGGLVAAQFGTGASFAMNVASFGISALLLASVTIPQAAVQQGERALDAIREGIAFALGAPVIRVVFAATGAAMFAASLKQPLEPVFVVRTLDGTAQDIGLAAAAWGLGMVLGSASAAAGARRWSHEQLMTAGLAGMGAAVLIAAQVPTPASLALAWLCGGAANGLLNVAYETLLQVRTPDRVRGRVIAACEAVLDTGVVGGLLLAGTATAVFGTRGTYAVAGGLLVLSGVLAALVLHRRPSGVLAADAVRFVPSALEHVAAGTHVLVRTAGEWRSPAADDLGVVRLAVGRELRDPLPDPTSGNGRALTGERPAPWRAAWALTTEEFSALGNELRLVAGATIATVPVAAGPR